MYSYGRVEYFGVVSQCFISTPDANGVSRERSPACHSTMFAVFISGLKDLLRTLNISMREVCLTNTWHTVVCQVTLLWHAMCSTRFNANTFQLLHKYHIPINKIFSINAYLNWNICHRLWQTFLHTASYPLLRGPLPLLVGGFGFGGFSRFKVWFSID